MKETKKKYNGILIDLDNTLYEYEPVHSNALKGLFHSFCSAGLESEANVFKKNYDLAKKKVKSNTQNQAASHNRLLYIQALLEGYDKFDPAIALNLYNSYWDTFLRKMSVYPDALEFLSTLKIPIVIVTDLTAEIQFRKLKKLGIADYFKGIVTSEEAGCEKPSQKIFQLALQKIGLPPSEVCFIGDNFQKDIKGANQMGMDAFWIQREGLVDDNEGDSFITFSRFEELNDYFK